MDAKTSHAESTFFSDESPNVCNKTENEKSSSKSGEDMLDISKTDDTENNISSEMTTNNLNVHNQFEEKTYSHSRVLRKGSVSKNVEEILPLESTPKSQKMTEENIQTAFDESEIHSCSSSDEMVLQTRFHVQGGNITDEDEQNNFLERTFDTDNILENYSETNKTSPIIIQAVPYEKNAVIDFDNVNKDSKVKQVEINKHHVTRTDMINDHSSGMEANTSDIEKGNCMESLIKNNNELLDCNIKKGRNKVPQEMIEPLTPVNENNSLVLDFGGLDDISVDLMQDFLNGSFNVNTYHPDSTSINITEKDSEGMNFGENKFSAETVQKIRGDISKYNELRSNTYGLFIDTNKTKKKNFRSRKNNLVVNPADGSIKSSKRKTPQKQANKKKAKVTATEKKSTKNINTTAKRSKENGLKSHLVSANTFSNGETQVNKLFNHKNESIINSFDRKNENTKTKTRSNKSKGEICRKKEIPNDFGYGNILVRNSRNSRYNKLNALRKIKRIGKLENSEKDFDEMCFVSDGYSNSDIYDFTSNNIEENIKDKYSGMFHSENQNDKYKIENKVQSDSFWNKCISDNTPQFDHTYLGGNEETENRIIRNNKYQKIIKDTFDACRLSSKIPFIEENKDTTNKTITSDIYLFNDFIEEDKDLYNNSHSSKMEIKKRRYDLNYEGIENKVVSISNNKIGKNALRKNDVPTDFTYKGAMTQSRKKSWEMLEKTLLEEMDDTSLENNVCETVLLKKEKLIRKQNIKDADLYTVSNRSVMETISKSKRGNKYNLQCEIQNAERKYLDAANKGHSYLNISNNIQPTEIISSKSKSANIVNRAIAAMEKCTSKFIEPQVNIIENDEKHSTFQFEDSFDDSDINQEAEFHSKLTFMRNENKQYYKNEIIGYMKKSTRKKNVTVKGESNSLSTDNFIVGDKYEISNDAEYLQKNMFVTKNYLKNKAKEPLVNGSKAIVSYSTEHYMNPWDKLMSELNLEPRTKKNACPKNISKNEYKQNKMEKLVVLKDSMKQYTNTHSDTNMLVSVDFDDKEITKYNNSNYTRSEQEIPMLVSNTQVGLHTTRTHAANDFNIINNKATNDFGCRRNVNKRSSSKIEYRRNAEKSSEKIRKDEKNMTQVQKVQKSPKFKLQIAKTGGLQFEKYYDRSSSSANSSDSRQSTQNTRKCQKRNKSAKVKTPETKKEKYKKYLRNIFNDEQDLLKEAVNNQDEVQDKNEVERKVKRKLLAENDDDVFSLSSDSEQDDKNQGSGLLCELFDTCEKKKNH